MSDFYTNIILKMVYTVYMSERYMCPICNEKVIDASPEFETQITQF